MDEPVTCTCAACSPPESLEAGLPDAMMRPRYPSEPSLGLDVGKAQVQDSLKRRTFVNVEVVIIPPPPARGCFVEGLLGWLFGRGGGNK